jgi:spore germination cell wall hydrolase CwlJ-like protein
VAVYHEARDQPLDGQLAVASVILNRASHPERWGRRPCDVVRPGQFSFFAPNGSYPPITEHEAWSIAVEMSREALERGPSTLVGQADHYYAKGASPTWDRGMVRVIRINDHIFFADLAVRS